jgi:type IV pilus assembly protein PilW
MTETNDITRSLVQHRPERRPHPAHAFTARPAGARGLTLVELMVALTIALVILAAMAQLFASSRGTYSLEEGLARVQEGGRFTFDILANDIRQAGYFGCISLPPTIPGRPDPFVGSTVSGALPASSYDASTRAGLKAYRYVGSGGADLAADWSPALTTDQYFAGGVGRAPRPWSDVLVVRYATGETVQLVNDTATDTAIQISDTYAGLFSVGQVLMVANCSTADLFVLTGKSAASGKTTLGHDTSKNSSAILQHTYTVGDELMRFGTNVYFVANTDRIDPQDNRPIPALYRKSLDGSNVVNVGNGVELIEGVEAMKVFFGILEGSKSSTVPNRYVPADQVTDWSVVTSVRLGVVVSTAGNVTTTEDYTATLDLVGLAGDTMDDYNPTDDRRQRRVFSTVVFKQQPPR